MEKVYGELIEADFGEATTFNLDEYMGVGPEDPGSYAHYMQEHLFRHVNLSAERINLLDGLTDDPEKECRSFEEAIERAGGIDIQLLGIGENGHIAFNEPGAVGVGAVDDQLDRGPVSCTGSFSRAFKNRREIIL